VPGFPVWHLAGLLGSTGWGLWVAALGVTVLLGPVRTPRSSTNSGVNALNAPFGNTHNPARPTAARLRS
jgi:hypothetical protein